MYEEQIPRYAKRKIRLPELPKRRIEASTTVSPNARRAAR
jgi:hypothetical protein